MMAASDSVLDRILIWLFASFLLASTFSIALSQLLLGLSILVWLVIVARDRINPFGGELKPVYLAVGAFFLWMFISPLFGETPWQSFVIAKEHWLFLAIPVGVHVFARPENRRPLILMLSLGLVVMSIYGTIQYFTGLHWPRPKPPTATPGGWFFIEGTFTHHLTYGNYFAMAGCFVLGWGLLGERQAEYNSGARYGVAAGLLALGATVLSLARTASAALLPGVLLLAMLKGRRWFVWMVAVVVVVSTATLLLVPSIAGRYELALRKDFAGESEAARVHIWEKSLEIVKENPVFGVGHGNFREAYKLQNDPNLGESRHWPHAHNDFVSVAAVTGIPGFVLFVQMWLLVGWAFVRGWRRFLDRPDDRRLIGAAMVGSLVFLLCSLTEATFDDEEVRVFLMVVWAAGLAPLAGAAVNSVYEPEGHEGSKSSQV